MKIALVQCPAWGVLPPLGAAALKAYLAEHDIDARCFDLNIDFFHEEQRARAADTSGAYGGLDPWGAESFDQWALADPVEGRADDDIRFRDGSRYNDHPLPLGRWADEVLDWGPDIVGFTVYLTSLASSLQLAQEIKRRSPGVTIVFGGPQVAQDQMGFTALRTGIPDVVVDGEGEATLVEVARAVERGARDLSAVAGTGSIVDGIPVWAPKRPLISKIDSLPFPDFSDFDWPRYEHPMRIPIMSSRGCVLDCSFCYETVYWRRFRTQSPQRIVDEMAYQVAHHPLREQAEADGDQFYFMFADSLVNGHLGGLRRMCDLLIERDLPVTWGGQATINTKMDADFFDKLRRAGCTGLAFGLESGSQRVLASMGKHFHIDDAAEFIRTAHEAKVTVTVNIMVGYPNETFRDFLHTLGFVAKTRRWLYQVSNVTTTHIALGSELHAHPEEYGVTLHPDGSWTSSETGDQVSRDRRLTILHLWMKLLRVPHQEIAPSHKQGLLRRPRKPTVEPPDVTTAEDRGWIFFPTTGAGPSDHEPVAYRSTEPFARIRVDPDGIVEVQDWQDTPLVPLSRADVHGRPIAVLGEYVVSSFGDQIAIDPPTGTEPERARIRGRSIDGQSLLDISAAPVRDQDGTLQAVRFHLWAEPLPQPVQLTSRQSDARAGRTSSSRP